MSNRVKSNAEGCQIGLNYYIGAGAEYFPTIKLTLYEIS